jgi:hypothetical protein
VASRCEGLGCRGTGLFLEWNQRLLTQEASPPRASASSFVEYAYGCLCLLVLWGPT